MFFVTVHHPFMIYPYSSRNSGSMLDMQICFGFVSMKSGEDGRVIGAKVWHYDLNFAFTSTTATSTG